MVTRIVALSSLLALLMTGHTGVAQLKKLRTGNTIGELKAIAPAPNKRDVIIDVLAPGEEKARRYTVGAQQKDIVAAVHATKSGTRVEIDWYDTVEGLCVDKFRVLPKEKGK